MNRRDLERGATSVEAAYITPVLFLLLSLVAAVGSVALGEQNITTAAHSAARAASLSTSQEDATGRVEEAFTQELNQRGKSCTNLSVSINADAFSAPPGEVGTIHSTITCTVPYAQLMPIPGLPGTRTITVETTSALDTYRERS